MPFYPTADVDDGYDITDFYAVDPRLGSFGDFTEFVRTAQDRGLRVIADLVVQPHQRRASVVPGGTLRPRLAVPRLLRLARRAAARAAGRRRLPRQGGEHLDLRPDREQYYLHRFYRSQPDLNVANPRVRDEIAKIMGFWMQLGLSGFRVDAVPFLIDTAGIDGGSEALPDPHAYLRDLRALPEPPPRRRRPARRGEPEPSGQRARSSATRTATRSRCCSTSRPCRRASWHWRGGTPVRSAARSARGRRRRPTRSGPSSSATTTSSRSTS